MAKKKEENEPALEEESPKEEKPKKESATKPKWLVEMKHTKKEPKIKPGMKVIKRGFRHIWVEEEPKKKVDIPKIDGKLKPSEWALRYGLNADMLRPHDRRFEKGLSQGDFEKEFKRYLPVR